MIIQDLIRTYPDRDLLWASLTQIIVRDLTVPLSRGDRASVALPGGSTPGPLYDMLSGVGLEWDRVDILPTDERWVDEADPRSNAGLLRRRLLRDKAAAGKLISLYGGTEYPEESLPVIESRVRALLPLDVVVLGMGLDGHVASLFPDADKIRLALSRNAPPVVAMRVESQPEIRVTLSAPVINGAMSKHLVILGKAKMLALEEAAGAPPEIAPVNAVLDDLTIHWAE